VTSGPTFSPLPLHYDLIQRRQSLAATASRIGERLLTDIGEILERELGIGWIPIAIRPAKRPSRIMAKIVRAIQEEAEQERVLSFEEALHHKVKDWAGGRFLIPYLSDVQRAQQVFCDYIQKRRNVRLDGDGEDYNASPRPSGYRGLHQGILLRMTRDAPFPFEVQFLTFLQADWALKEHLVYENPTRYPEELRNKLLELSDRLHEISESFDRLRADIDRIPGSA
jgi:ppGpp synthetase/RelA/SpoT-type nucleotidyltranferase